MALMKLKIYTEDSDFNLPGIEVLYNPNKVTLNKTANWKAASTLGGDSEKVQFTAGQSATLSLELFFDTYETGEDVRIHTNKIFRLTLIDNKLSRPPLCKLQWGVYTFDHFQWALTSLVQNFTLFKSDGTPVRATLSCSFLQWRANEDLQKILETDPQSVTKRHIVRAGETLASIAAVLYNSAGLWRVIAKANGIDNPRRLVPGQILSIPGLDQLRRLSKRLKL